MKRFWSSLISCTNLRTKKESVGAAACPCPGSIRPLQQGRDKPLPLRLRIPPLNASWYWLWPTITFISVIVVIFFAFIAPAYGARYVGYRGIAVLWFVTLCPGMSLVSLLKLDHFFVEVTLAIALSLSIDGIVVGCFLYAGYWSPPAMLWVLIVLSLVGPAKAGVYEKIIGIKHHS